MGLFAQPDLTSMFFLGALALTIGILLLRSHRYLSRQAKNPGPLVKTHRPEDRKRGHNLGAPDEVLRWQVEMQETARDLSGQLDSKMSALGHLIREADRAVAQLESALDAASRVADRTRVPDTPIEQSTLPSSSDHSPPRPTNQAEALKSQKLGSWRSELDQADAGNKGPSRQNPSPERRYEEIYLLADYGFETPEIARRVGSPVGEVELILGLRRKR